MSGSDAECAFAVVHRGLTAEGGPHEFGLPTFVSRRFVDAAAGDRGRTTSACAPPRRPPRVRGGRRRPRARAHVAARHRVPLAFRAVAAPEPGRSARSARGSPAPTAPGARLRGAPAPRRLGAPPRSPPPPTSSWSRSNESAVVAGRVRRARPPVHALTVDGAEVSALLRDDAARSRCGSSTSPRTVRGHRRTRRRSGRRERGRPHRRPAQAVRRAAPLRPWEILTLRLDG